MLPVEQRLGRDAQHVVVRGVNDLDIGAVAHQKPVRGGKLVEVHLDLHRAGLLFHFQHIGRDAPDMSHEGFSLDRIERDLHRLTQFDPGCIDLVYRRADIETAVVYQVYGRRRGNAGRGGGRVFPELSADLGHDAVEGGFQDQPV